MITPLNTVVRASVYRFLARLVLLLTLVLGTFGAASAQTVTYFHNDIAGTPMLATNAAGAVVWKENYLPYGYRQVADPASSGNKLWFTGKPHDPDTQLSYMGARYYMPLLGRFTGIDPVGILPEQPHSFNRYAYANNNPYKYLDPDGRFAIPLMIKATGATVFLFAGAKAAMTTPEQRAQIARQLGQESQRLSDALGRVSNWAFSEGADSEDKPSLLDPKGETHVLDGDRTGGGHRSGTGKPGKSEFPSGWSDDRIKGEISDVATDPASSRAPGRGGREVVRGTRGGIDIEVIVDPSGRIVTGYPTNVPRNPR